MTEGDASAGERTSADAAPVFNFTGSLAVAIVVGVALALTSRTGPVALTIAIGAVQTLLAFAWVLGLRLPGSTGGVVIGLLAAAGADAVVLAWPHGRLGTLLAVAGMALPVMFVHQLLRGAGRVRVLESLGGISILVVAEVSLPSLVQLRNEFAEHGTQAQVSLAVVAAGAAGLVVGYLIDLIVAAPRFDRDVPRGLLAVIGSAVVGAVVGYLALRSGAEFVGGRGVFVGAVLGALVGLLAVGTAFIEYSVTSAASGFSRRVRPTLGAVVPLCLIAPVGFLLCLAVRA